MRRVHPRRPSRHQRLGGEPASAQSGPPIRITLGDTELTGRLHDNAAARDLAAQLPLTLTFRDHNGVEKTAPLPRELSLDDAPEGHDPSAGEIGYWAPEATWSFTTTVTPRSSTGSSGLASSMATWEPSRARVRISGPRSNKLTRSQPQGRIGHQPLLVPKSEYIRAHPQASEPQIDAYSCLRVPRFAIRRSAVRARLAPLLVSGFLTGDTARFLSTPMQVESRVARIAPSVGPRRRRRSKIPDGPGCVDRRPRQSRAQLIARWIESRFWTWLTTTSASRPKRYVG